MSHLQKKATTRMSQQHLKEAYSESPPENYERFFVPVIGAPLAADLIECAELRPGERVLDVACGTGVATRLAAERVGAAGTVDGVDINPGMLAVARTVTTPPETSIKWYESAAEALPFPDEAFDVVLCQLSLQFFQDRLAALREIRRVLTPGGRVVVNVPGAIAPVFAVMAKALARHISPELADFVHQVFSLHDADELQRLMSSVGFREIHVHTQAKTLRLPPPKEFLWQYVYSTPLAEAVARVNDERRAAVEHDVVEEWQAFVEDGALMYRQDIVLATATKGKT